MKQDNINILQRSKNWYTESLHRADTSSNAIFRCPICLQDINNENQFIQDIANAHIIPKALRGKNKTFVCKDCDNTIGRRYEGQFINWAKNTRRYYGKESGKLRGKLEYVKNNIICPAQLNVQKDKGWEVILPRRGDAMYVLDKIPPNGIIRDQQKFNFLYTPPGEADDLSAQTTFLKIAYLGTFLSFGYDYILHKQLNWVRQMLLSNVKNHAPYNFTFIFPKNLIRTKKEFPFLFLFDGDVNDIPALICVLRLFESQLLVLLPPKCRELPNNFKGYVIANNGCFDITLSINLPALAFLV